MTYAQTPDDRTPTKTAGYRISAFIRSFTNVIIVAMGMAVVGLVMKYAFIGSGNFIFVFAMAVLALLFLVQVGLSFFYVISNVRLALLGSICSVALVLGFTALIFLYQDWYGWQITFSIALPVFIVTAYYLFRYFRKRETLQPQHRSFLHQNLILPYLFILILGILSAVSGNRFINSQPDPQLQRSPVDTQETPHTTGMWRAY